MAKILIIDECCECIHFNDGWCIAKNIMENIITDEIPEFCPLQEASATQEYDYRLKYRIGED